MNRTEALNLFNIQAGSDSSEVQNAIEEELFLVKKEVLLKYVVPRLLAKKTPQIHQLTEAELLLTGAKDVPATNDSSRWAEEPGDRISFLEHYEQHVSCLKMELMECKSFHQLGTIVGAFISTQEFYMTRFKRLFQGFSEALPEEVNTREIIDTGELLMALKKGEPDNKLTWEIELELARIGKIQRLESVTN